MFCLDMLAIALESALENPVYEELACKFYEHFMYIAIGKWQMKLRVGWATSSTRRAGATNLFMAGQKSAKPSHTGVT